MTRIKLCGLSTPCDIHAANELKPEYVGFVFAAQSRRFVTASKAAELKRMLAPDVKAVGVFVNETPQTIARLLNDGVIDLAQLHGSEDEETIRRLRNLTDQPIIQAFRIKAASDIAAVEQSTADYVLVDAGAGTGTTFNWDWIQDMKRPYFLAGGLSPSNVREAVARLHPFAVDVSSGIERGGAKDQTKMTAFVAAVRKEEQL